MINMILVLLSITSCACIYACTYNYKFKVQDFILKFRRTETIKGMKILLLKKNDMKKYTHVYIMYILYKYKF